MNFAKILKISIVVVALVSLTYFLVNVFIQGDRKTNVSYQKFANTVARKSNSSTNISTQGTDPTEVSVDGILINLRGGQYQYMKSDMSFKMKDKKDKEDLENNILKVRDLVLRYTSTINSDMLTTSKGKEQYKKGLKDIIYSTFGYKIEDIYFRNFVLAQ